MKQGDILPSLYGQKIVYLPTVVRLPLFLVLFFIQLILNIIDGAYNLAINKTNFSRRTQNETVLGRDFTYDILKICSIKGYKTMIIGGSNEDDNVSKSLIQKMYPDLDVVLWTRKTNSLLMQDKPLPYSDLDDLETKGLKGFFNKITTPKPFLTTYNLFERFPDLIDAKKAVIKEKPDVILTCLGGASGKQEFFIDNLVKDKECSFKMATGLGAAIDHLGGGKKQKLPPKWAQKMGLEWLFRFFDQPYRRLRIVDSILTLYWWTTLDQFMKEVEEAGKKNMVINYLYKKAKTGQEEMEEEIFINYPRSILPSAIGINLPAHNIPEKSSIEEAGLKGLERDYRIKLSSTDILKTPEKGREIALPVSLLGFILQGCRYTHVQYYINYASCFESSTKLPLKYLKTRFAEISEVSETLNPDYIQHPNRPNFLGH
jgi:UDP-N-acetyl-D-mannosaminuronic acid transferase (WecB/TagA/CpsF family)